MNLSRIPHRLHDMRQWVCVDNGSKIPMRPDRSTASVSDRSTWSSWEDVQTAVQDKRHDGVGFVFDRNGVVGIDIDDGFDDEGFVTPKAADIILNCGSYTELSRSGRGFHILVGGKLPFDGKNNRDGVEAYQAGRYFILTGETILYDSITDNQAGIDYVAGKYFPEIAKVGNHKVSSRVYAPEWQRPEGRRLPVRPAYPEIPNGCRNICLTSLGGLMHTVGYTAKQIQHELAYVNRIACKPPLDDAELMQICRSVVRYTR